MMLTRQLQHIGRMAESGGVMKDLVIGNIEISWEVDSDGEICIDVPHYQYINKDDAKQIIEHLQKVFNLGVDNDNLVG